MQELLSLWSWGASPSQGVDELTLGALRTLDYWDFMAASPRMQSQSLIPLPAPPLSKEDEGGAEASMLLTKACSFR